MSRGPKLEAAQTSASSSIASLIAPSQHFRKGSKCEELSMSKPSPLHVHERTSMQRAATSPTGRFQTHALQ
jgi:hypothetical protein